MVDPVMVSTSGDTLSEPSTLAKYRNELFAMADIVTPNVKEASKLLGGVSLRTVSDMRSAAESIYKFGPQYAFHISVNLCCCSKVLLPYLFPWTTFAISCGCISRCYTCMGKRQPGHPVFLSMYMNLNYIC